MLGAILLLGIIASTVVSIAIRGQGSVEAEESVSTDGIDTLRVNTATGAVTVEFGDVTEAEMHATGPGADRWDLTSSAGVITLQRDNMWGFDVDWIFGWAADRPRVRLTLPSELEGDIDAYLSSSAGSVAMRGDAAEVSIDVSAGRVDFEGASTALDVSVSAGDADVSTSGPDVVSLDVSAGRIEAIVDGEPPTATTVKASAGSIELELPDAAYSVSESRSAGASDINLRTDPASEYTLDVRVSAGSVEVTS